MMKAGLCSVTFRKLSVQEIIELAKGNRLSCIEWGSDIHVPETNLKNAEAVGKLTRAAGLECPSYGTYFKCREGEDFNNYSLAAEQLGAKTIRVWAGEQDAEQWSQAEYCSFIKRVQSYAELAHTRGQTVAFEFHYGTFNNSAERALQMLQDIGRENVKTYFQPMYWLNVSEEEEARANLKAIEQFKEKIANVHVYRWRGFERFALSEGANDWREYIKAIGNANYYLEFVKNDDPLQFQSDSAVLLKLLKEQSRAV